MPTDDIQTIAVLADAHANGPALEAVLRDVRRNKIKHIWYLGDFIGYGPNPQKVVRLLKGCVSRCIAGNYDQNVLRFPGKKKKWKRIKDPSKYFSFAWTYKHIGEEERSYLSGLPHMLETQAMGKKFLLVHGSPEAIDDPLTVDTPRERFVELAKTVKADVVLFGHTHVYMTRHAGGVHFINPGSVGRPFDGNPAASYIILEKSKTGIKARNVRIKYDLRKVLKKMNKEGFPRDICRSIESGRSLNDINNKEYKNSAEKAVISEVLKLARSCDYEQPHSHQVTRLALKLFDELTVLHGLGKRQRLLLQSSSLLHDIGWVKGRVRHHKTARDIILKSFGLPLTDEERLIVALVARYHRRVLPRNSHKYYSDLEAGKKDELKKLAGILRVADGLDRCHLSTVKDLECSLKGGDITIHIESNDFADQDKETALKKGDLFRDVFQKNIKIVWNKK